MNDQIPETVSVLFTLDELWLLQALVRHVDAHYPPEAKWLFPPYSLELNDQIASSILLCTETDAPDAPLLLSRGDCLLIDFCVQSSAKDVNGVPIGRNILLKSFAARRDLSDPLPISHGPEMTASDVKAALSFHEPEESHEYDRYQ